MDYGVPLGRRFRALKLWFIMRSYGREGLAAAIREHVRLAQVFARQVEADPRFEHVVPGRFSVVNFRYKGTDDENLACWSGSMPPATFSSRAPFWTAVSSCTWPWATTSRPSRTSSGPGNW